MTGVAAGCVAFHDVVTLLGWSESSGQGARVKFALPGREALEHFDTATRRRKRRAGQRYYAVLGSVDNPPLTIATINLWFAGANWAHQDGARVVFAVEADDLEAFRDMHARDQGAQAEASVFWLTLVQIDDDEQPIDQDKAARVEDYRYAAGDLRDAEADAHPQRLPEDVRAADKLKGGPRSKNVAQLCYDDEFQWFVSEREDRDEKSTFTEADAYVKRVVGIASKVELDHDDTAWQRFIDAVRRPFFAWAGQ